MARNKLKSKNKTDNLKSKDKIITKMSKDGATQQNATSGEQKSISKRDKHFDLRDSHADLQINDFAQDMPPEIYNAMFSGGDIDNTTPTVTAPKSSNHPTFSGSSQVGTRLDDAPSGKEVAKRNATKKRHRQARSAESSGGSDKQAATSPLAEIYDFNNHLVDDGTSKSGEQTQPSNNAKTAQKSKLMSTTEHEPRAKIRHKSKTAPPLNQHRLSNLKQTPKVSKFVVTPALDENGRRVDTADGKQPVKRQKNKAFVNKEQSHKFENADNADPQAKIKFIDEGNSNFSHERYPADETRHGGVADDVATYDYDPTNQPRSPTTIDTSIRSKQVRHSRKDATVKQGNDANKIEHAGRQTPLLSASDNSANDEAVAPKLNLTKPSPQSPQQSGTATSATPKPSAKISKLEHGVAKTSKKLDKAKDNLPAKRKVGLERTFDDETGKGKTRIKFETEVKSQREHLKGPLPLRPVKFGANTAIAKAHVKMYQVEYENVGVKAAHKVELLGEATVRSALRHRKLSPYKKVAKLERKLSERSTKLAYKRVLHENPKIRRNPVARMWQKRKLKRKHIKAAKQAQNAAIKAKKAGTLTARATKAVTMLIKKNPKVIIIVAALFLIVNILTSIVGMLSSVGSSGAGAIFATTYLSDESDIEAASLAYNRWEMDLMLEIQNVEQNHPGFDEYRFNTGEIIHNPFELMAYLTATYFIFTFSEIEVELRALFDEQYQLSFTPSIEIRYRNTGEVDTDGNPIYEPFEWHVMTVTLVARNFTDVIFSRMTAEQRLHFDLLMQSRGHRQIVGNPFSFPWQAFITSEYGYRIHPITGAVDLHRGIDIGVPTGTEILAGFDGTVTFAGMLGGYGNVVIIQGDNGIEARYAHMDTIGVSVNQTVLLGAVIGTVGSTGDSTGPHLHMEVLRHGNFLNPLFFVDMGQSNSSRNYGIPSEALDDENFAALWAVIQQALGRPYVWGASGPNAFDCSGFIFHVFNQSGVANIPRTTAQGYYNMSTRITRNELRPGDLVFFEGTFSTYRTVTHVGVYIGGGMMAHAGSPVEITSFETPFWTRHFYGFGRLN